MLHVVLFRFDLSGFTVQLNHLLIYIFAIISVKIKRKLNS